MTCDDALKVVVLALQFLAGQNDSSSDSDPGAMRVPKTPGSKAFFSVRFGRLQRLMVS